MVEGDAPVWDTGPVTTPENGPAAGSQPTGSPGADPETAPSEAVAAEPAPEASAPELAGAEEPEPPADLAAQSDPEITPATPPTRWRTALLLAIALAVLAVDAATKALVVAKIAPGDNIRILGGLVYLTNIRNPGAAFSMATSMTWVLAVIALAVVAFIIRMAPKLRSTPWAVCLGLVLGGALGNLTDRIFRAPGVLRGHVVDFVSVFGPDAVHFPAFNAADSAITVGGVILVAVAIFGHDYDGTSHRSRRRRPGPVGPVGRHSADG